MKKIINIITILFFVTSCGGIDDAAKVLKNEKIRTTDEFLVKKRDPLIFPPDMKEAPVPNSIKSKKTKEKKTIREILKVPEETNNRKIKSSSVEKSILEELRK